ncbi:MAG TPA: PEP-utilizing enzyme [Candidatus Bathyarchaeia archaeon]|nr:PEP-utilizing enzyme [Candidatus Bathyarchaeia archaeon]
MNKIISGKAFIVRSERDYYKIKKEVILIAERTHPDIVIAIKKVTAIVTEIDNKLCHAAIISREYGIPLLMGIADATKNFKTGDKVMVNLDTKTICKIK